MATKKTRAKRVANKSAQKRTAKKKKKSPARKPPKVVAKSRRAKAKPESRKRATTKPAVAARRRAALSKAVVKAALANQGQRVVVLFRDNIDVPQTRGFNDKRGEWKAVRALGGEDLVPVFTNVAIIDELEARSRHARSDELWPRYRNAFFLKLKRGSDTARVVDVVSKMAEVRLAYEDMDPVPASNSCGTASAHLDGNCKGVNAQAAWELRGGLGEGQLCVDIEQGWVTHSRIAHPNRVSVLCGQIEGDIAHGTAVLGIVCGKQPATGCRGIAPEIAAMRLASYSASLFVQVPDRNALPPNSIYEAFAEAVAFLTNPGPQFANSAGGVLLIEVQTPDKGLPIEILPVMKWLITSATADGITVIEPAGNGANRTAHDLDLVHRKIWENGVAKTVFPLRRGQPGDVDSGAIMVGAAEMAVITDETGASVHAPVSNCNYGGRVDCYAWGQGINAPTLVLNGNPPMPAADQTACAEFSETSGAAAIIAGVAVLLKGIAAEHVFPLGPATLRTELCRASHGTPSTAQIGTMPDLAIILRTVNGFSPVFGVQLIKRQPS
jgi:hypothetical protein